jgi:hypothetical protein
MHPIHKTLLFLHNRRNQITLLFFLTCSSVSYSQNACFSSDEIGVSKIDNTGAMSKIVWTKSKVAVLMNTTKNCIHVFVMDASRSQVYNEVILTKKVETVENDIRTFHAVNIDGDECMLILTKNKNNGKEEQLRIYLVDRVYIYNFVKA